MLPWRATVDYSALEWQLVNVQVLAVYSDNRQNVAKVRAFVDGIARRLD
jgi:hypothetical protein